MLLWVLFFRVVVSVFSCRVVLCGLFCLISVSVWFWVGDLGVLVRLVVV